MSFELNKSTQFKIKELVIVTKFGQIDISGICDEINIFRFFIFARNKWQPFN